MLFLEFPIFGVYSYCPGDVVVIMPQNSLESVQEFIDHMKLRADDYFSIHQQDPGKVVMKRKISNLLKKL